MKDLLKKLLTRKTIAILQTVAYYPKDILNLLLKKRNPMVPPVRMMFDGPKSQEIYIQNGREFLRHYLNLCGLKPHHKMLDIGCGIGRKTVPLTQFLNKDGSYDGIDIVKRGIDWCNLHIAQQFPNFKFTLSRVYNKEYNPGGAIPASEYEFPYPSKQFDFIALNSVFTHMTPKDLGNYLSEISRMLKPGGKCFISYFLLNDESKAHIQRGESTLDFKYEYENYFIINQKSPEDAIAYDEFYIKKLYESNKLKIDPPIHYGNWCKRQNYLSYQDIIIAEK